MVQIERDVFRDACIGENLNRGCIAERSGFEVRGTMVLIPLMKLHYALRGIPHLNTIIHRNHILPELSISLISHLFNL